eukprot:g10731.t1
MVTWTGKSAPSGAGRGARLICPVSSEPPGSWATGRGLACAPDDEDEDDAAPAWLGWRGEAPLLRSGLVRGVSLLCRAEKRLGARLVPGRTRPRGLGFADAGQRYELVQLEFGHVLGGEEAEAGDEKANSGYVWGQFLAALVTKHEDLIVLDDNGTPMLALISDLVKSKAQERENKMTTKQIESTGLSSRAQRALKREYVIACNTLSMLTNEYNRLMCRYLWTLDGDADERNQLDLIRDSITALQQQLTEKRRNLVAEPPAHFTINC